MADRILTKDERWDLMVNALREVDYLDVAEFDLLAWAREALFGVDHPVVEVTDSGLLCCPECGALEGFRFTEAIEEWRPVACIDEGTIWILPDPITQYSEPIDDSAHLECGACLASLGIPEGVTYDFDYDTRGG